mgnify:CR=1 FL=1
MKARYNRISTANQNLERQLAKQNLDEVLYNDVISGSIAFAKRLRGKELIADIEAATLGGAGSAGGDQICAAAQ